MIENKLYIKTNIRRQLVNDNYHKIISMGFSFIIKTQKEGISHLFLVDNKGVRIGLQRFKNGGDTSKISMVKLQFSRTNASKDVALSKLLIICLNLRKQFFNDQAYV